MSNSVEYEIYMNTLAEAREAKKVNMYSLDKVMKLLETHRKSIMDFENSTHEPQLNLDMTIQQLIEFIDNK